MAQTIKNLPAMQETWTRSLDWEDPLEKGIATHSSILAWRIPWTGNGFSELFKIVGGTRRHLMPYPSKVTNSAAHSIGTQMTLDLSRHKTTVLNLFLVGFIVTNPLKHFNVFPCDSNVLLTFHLSSFNHIS